jgi:hypothetical protein
MRFLNFSECFSFDSFDKKTKPLRLDLILNFFSNFTLQVETESRISSIKQTFESEKTESAKLKKIVENNRKSKEKLKLLILDVTLKLEQKLRQLMIENNKLKELKK